MFNKNLQYIVIWLSLTAFALMLSQYASWSLQATANKKPVVLAGADAQCQQAREYKQWYILYGSVPLTNIDSKALLSSGNSALKISSKATWWDTIISGLGGLSLSLTRKTILVSDCAMPAGLLTRADLESRLEAEREKIRAEFESQKESEDNDDGKTQNPAAVDDAESNNK